MGYTHHNIYIYINSTVYSTQYPGVSNVCKVYHGRGRVFMDTLKVIAILKRHYGTCKILYPMSTTDKVGCGKMTIMFSILYVAATNIVWNETALGNNFHRHLKL